MTPLIDIPQVVPGKALQAESEEQLEMIFSFPSWTHLNSGRGGLKFHEQEP
jgi:hypothetical protein